MRSTRNFVAMFPLNSKKSQFYHASTLAKGQSSGIKSLFPRSSIITHRLLCLQKPVWNIAMVLQFPICSDMHSQITANASRCVIRTKLTERSLNDKKLCQCDAKYMTWPFRHNNHRTQCLLDDIFELLQTIYSNPMLRNICYYNQFRLGNFITYHNYPSWSP